MMFGKPVATISDAAVGCTFECKKYSNEELAITFFDTVGLNEPNKGTVSAKDALTGLIMLLKSLETGVNLLVFVIRKEKITETMVKNYAVFSNGICDRKVPVVLAGSGCELEENPLTWYNENEVRLDKKPSDFEV